jgi:hypothetical protein
MANTNNTCTEPLSAQPKLTQAEITGDENVLLFTPGKTNQATLIDAVSKANELNAYLFVKSKTVKLTTAQVLTLNTTPVPFGITVPVGYYAQLLSAQMKATYGGTPYATNVTLEIGFPSVKAIFSDNVLGFNSNVFFNMDFESSGQQVSATDVVVSVNAGNPTAGNSDITVIITYILIPTPI